MIQRVIISKELSFQRITILTCTSPSSSNLAELAYFYEFASGKTVQQTDWKEKKKKPQMATGHAEHHQCQVSESCRKHSHHSTTGVLTNSPDHYASAARESRQTEPCRHRDVTSVHVAHVQWQPFSLTLVECFTSHNGESLTPGKCM